MLAKQHRLRKTSDFNYVLRKGSSVSIGNLGLKFIDNQLPQTRFGFLAASKVFRKASLRNQIRRKMREAARQALGLVQPGKDILLIARSGIEKNSVSEVRAIIFSALSKIKWDT